MHAELTKCIYSLTRRNKIFKKKENNVTILCVCVRVFLLIETKLILSAKCIIRYILEKVHTSQKSNLLQFKVLHIKCTHFFSFFSQHILWTILIFSWFSILWTSLFHLIFLSRFFSLSYLCFFEKADRHLRKERNQFEC